MVATNAAEDDLLTPEEKRARQAVRNDSMLSARRFADADADGDQSLDFEEFFAMQPKTLRERHSVAEFRAWFDSADLDHSGALSISEFFLWTLSNATQKFGADALGTVFAQYDKDGTGVVDMHEFQHACDDAGFGLVAAQIFRTLDPDGSGTISYRELTSMACRSGAVHDAATKRMLTSLVWSYDAETKEETKAVLATEFHIHGDSVASIKRQMRQLLEDSGATVVDLIKKFDQDADRTLTVDAMEFNTAMRQKFGFEGPLEVIDRLFDSLDTDGSGQIGFDELYEFIRGKRHSLDYRNKRVRELSFQPPQRAGYTLEQVAWDASTLRLLFVQMMGRAHVSASDLIKAWDHNGNGELSEAEWLENLKQMFAGSETLWRDELQALAKKTFVKIARKAGDSRVASVKMDVMELEVWLRAAPSDHQAPPLRTPAKPPAAVKKKAKAPAPAKTLPPIATKEEEEDDEEDDEEEDDEFQASLRFGSSSTQPAAGPPAARPKDERQQQQLVASGGGFTMPNDSTGAPVQFEPPRLDIAAVIHGHALFWSSTTRRVRSRSRKLPPMGTRLTTPQPITASLPRHALPPSSPVRPKGDMRIG